MEKFFVRNANNDRILAGEDPRKVTLDRIRSVGLSAWPGTAVTPTGDSVPDVSLNPPVESFMAPGNQGTETQDHINRTARPMNTSGQELVTSKQSTRVIGYRLEPYL